MRILFLLGVLSCAGCLETHEAKSKRLAEEAARADCPKGKEAICAQAREDAEVDVIIACHEVHGGDDSGFEACKARLLPGYFKTTVARRVAEAEKAARRAARSSAEMELDRLADRNQAAADRESEARRARREREDLISEMEQKIADAEGAAEERGRKARHEREEFETRASFDRYMLEGRMAEDEESAQRAGKRIEELERDMFRPPIENPMGLGRGMGPSWKGDGHEYESGYISRPHYYAAESEPEAESHRTSRGPYFSERVRRWHEKPKHPWIAGDEDDPTTWKDESKDDPTTWYDETPCKFNDPTTWQDETKDNPVTWWKECSR